MQQQQQQVREGGAGGGARAEQDKAGTSGMDSEFSIEPYDMNDLSSNGTDALSLPFSANHVHELDILGHNEEEEEESRERVSQSQLVLKGMGGDGEEQGQGGPGAESETSVMIETKDCGARASPQGGSSLDSMGNNSGKAGGEKGQKQKSKLKQKQKKAKLQAKDGSIDNSQGGDGGGGGGEEEQEQEQEQAVGEGAGRRSGNTSANAKAGEAATHEAEYDHTKNRSNRPGKGVSCSVEEAKPCSHKKRRARGCPPLHKSGGGKSKPQSGNGNSQSRKRAVPMRDLAELELGLKRKKSSSLPSSTETAIKGLHVSGGQGSHKCSKAVTSELQEYQRQLDEDSSAVTQRLSLLPWRKDAPEAIDDKEMRGLLFQTVKLQLVLATYIKTRCQQELGKGRQRNKKHKSILEFQESYHESLKAKTLIKDSLSIAQDVLGAVERMDESSILKMRSIPLLRGQLDVNYENLQQLAIKFRKINEIEQKAQDTQKKYSEPSSELAPGKKPSSNEAAAGESARNGYKSAQPTTNKNSNIINNSACNQNNGSSEVDPCIPNLDPVNQGKYKHSPDAVAEQSSSNIAQLEPRQRSPQSYSSSRAQSPCLSKQEVLAGGQNIDNLGAIFEDCRPGFYMKGLPGGRWRELSSPMQAVNAKENPFAPDGGPMSPAAAALRTNMNKFSPHSSHLRVRGCPMEAERDQSRDSGFSGQNVQIMRSCSEVSTESYHSPQTHKGLESSNFVGTDSYPRCTSAPLPPLHRNARDGCPQYALPPFAPCDPGLLPPSHFHGHHPTPSLADIVPYPKPLRQTPPALNSVPLKLSWQDASGEGGDNNGGAGPGLATGVRHNSGDNDDGDNSNKNNNGSSSNDNNNNNNNNNSNNNNNTSSNTRTGPEGGEPRNGARYLYEPNPHNSRNMPSNAAPARKDHIDKSFLEQYPHYQQQEQHHHYHQQQQQQHRRQHQPQHLHPQQRFIPEDGGDDYGLTFKHPNVPCSGPPMLALSDLNEGNTVMNDALWEPRGTDKDNLDMFLSLNKARIYEELSEKAARDYLEKAVGTIRSFVSKQYVRLM